MQRTGVPTVPGSDGALPDDPDEVLRIARDIGFPVIVKAAAGGGVEPVGRAAGQGVVDGHHHGGAVDAEGAVIRRAGAAAAAAGFFPFARFGGI